MLEAIKYPRFDEPEKYLATRQTASLSTWSKTFVEQRILRRCLREMPGIGTVCDVPAGPGRLFPLWKRLGFRVLGVDFSPAMVNYAAQEQRELDLPGVVRLGDAFQLDRVLEEKPDLVACIRFAYYFAPEQRIELLKALARATGRYVLVQYKTADTYKGRRNLARQVAAAKRQKKHLRWHFATLETIGLELAAAGLEVIALRKFGPFSDRVLASARLAR